MQKTVALISLGCDKNRVDTEIMMQSLSDSGCIFTSDFERAEIIVVNTCAFINSARKEAVDTILSAAEYKKTGVCEKLIVTGCLPQKYSGELEELREADAFLGTYAYSRAPEVLNRIYAGERVFLTDCADGEGMPRILSTPPHYAYLKIADGCDNRCTYCTIPSIRGSYRSRTADSLIREAQGLAQDGVKELILVAQDTTRYGTDNNQPNLAALLKMLVRIDGIERFRVMYCYPELITDELIHTVSSEQKICKYMDIPLQHINSRILKLMNRRTDSIKIRNLLDNITRINENIIIRSSFITGFPTESGEEFSELLSFIEEGRIGRAGFFEYSREEGTPAAKMSGQIAKAVKRDRRLSLESAQTLSHIKANRSLAGRTLRVLNEGIDFNRSCFYGRTEWDAPGVDTLVYFRGEFCEAGKFYDVRITGYDGLNLLGEVSPLQGDKN